MRDFDEFFYALTDIQAPQPCDAVLCDHIVRIISGGGHGCALGQEGNDFGMKHRFSVFIGGRVGGVHGDDGFSAR